MRYLVMECAASYAVVLDREGCFHKVPNLGYAVGDVLDEVYLFDAPADPVDVAGPARRRQFRVVRWLAAAACFVALAIGGLAVWQTPIGVVRMQINPEVIMDVNRFDRVVGITGINDDGVELIEGYRAYGKDIETVTGELADRSREQRYLNPGDTIVIEVDSDDDAWTSDVEGRIVDRLEKYVGGDVIVITAHDAAQAAARREAREEDDRRVSEQTEGGASAEDGEDDDPSPFASVADDGSARAPSTSEEPTTVAPLPPSDDDDDDYDDDVDDDDDGDDDDDDDDDGDDDDDDDDDD